jgi:hypothetical protein
VRHAVLSSVAAAALLLASVMPALAASGVEITLHANFDTGEETFTATGAFCAGGTAETSDLRIVGGRSALTFHLRKTLTCDDGSGTLVMDVDAATSYGHPFTDGGGWSVAGGTGDWAGASGGGRLVGEYVADGVIDHYAGVIRR